MNGKSLGMVGVVLVALLAGGCVERKLNITSEPAGAIVRISDVEVGRTPVTVPFTYYGDYEIILRRDGYETVKTHANLTPPVYEIPPLDLLSAIVPWTYRDHRYVHVTMSEQQTPGDEELIEKARQLHQENLQPAD